ncbi:unnamed protein product [Musa textilis]
MHDFKVFRMQPSKTVGDMYTCFTDVVNSLRAFGKYFSNFELVNKILRSLSKNWDSKVIAIQEAKDLNDLPIEELIGSLITYEMTLLEHVGHDEHLNHLPKNRKDLKFRTNEYHLSDEDNDELELRTPKFNKFIKQKFKIKNEFERRKRPKKKKKARQEESSKEKTYCALTIFDNEVRNSPKLLLPYFEII